MSNFIQFRDAVNAQIDKMVATKGGLHLTHVDKSIMWQEYLGAFPEGTDPIYMTNTVHDCNCCKDFIRDIGRSVAIDDDLNLMTAWDISIDDETYQTVANALANYVRSCTIASVYRASSFGLDRKQNTSIEENKFGNTYDHFYYNVPSHYAPKDDNAEVMGDSRNKFNVFKRGLTELTISSLTTVADLIFDNDLYLGEQYGSRIAEFLEAKNNFDKVEESKKDLFVWKNLQKHPSVTMLRNSAIGTLLVDISEGMDVEAAVRAYENKVAPTNYKRSKAVVTKKMVEDAQKKVVELGLLDSLPRRHSSIDDISINNVIWADRKTTEKLTTGNVFDTLIAETDDKIDPNKLVDIQLLNFIDGVVPLAKSIEIYLENKHENNLVSLVSPVNVDAPNLMKWDNGYSWSYKGNVTDSIKARVAKKGGNVDGDVRASLSWYNFDDLDIHMSVPKGSKVYFGNRRSGGFALDVDENAGGGRTKTPVENISADKVSHISEGQYRVYVNNFHQRTSEDTGFELEFEFLGKVYNFTSAKSPKDNQTIHCFSFTYSKKDGVTISDINGSLEQKSATNNFWGLSTNKFQNVDSIMWSPNHWDDNEIGNRHLFFMLNEANNPEPVRGFYNEMLIEELYNHRKVFETLAGKMKAEPTPEQLSGLGFSTTKKGDSFIALVNTQNGNKIAYNVTI